ncbi:MAG TPA: sugar ABC transporter permease [Candidatus Limnocylindrales bacterium]|nr:sugar ABC transporter permease [Candidatus Limnocylindrales bacterium]
MGSLDLDRSSSGSGGHPLHARRDVLLLIAPTALYLVVFSIFPLLYSLGISFFDWSQITRSFTFVGLENYQRLLSDPVFLQSIGNTAILVGLGVAIQIALGTALALFFDLHLRGMWFVRGVLILPMLLTPVVVGLMWRALLNPEWGMVNWALGELGLPQPLWLADPSIALFTLVLVDSWQWTPFIFVIVFARLQALPDDVFEAAAADGAGYRQMLVHVTLPLLAPAIAFAAIFRAIDAFRSFDIVFGLTYGGPGNFTSTMSFYTWETGFSFTRYGYSSALAYVMVVVAIVMVTLLLRFLAVRRADAT